LLRVQLAYSITVLKKIMLIFSIIFSRFSVVIQDKVDEGLDNVVIIPISVIVLDENDNAPRYTVH
jgi:hypothetical protein